VRRSIDDGSMKPVVVAARLVFPLALLVLAACGGEDGGTSASHPKKAAPGYAATPRKALESW
jgi:hypothetical protein